VKISIELDPRHAEALRQYCDATGFEPENVARAGIVELLSIGGYLTPWEPEIEQRFADIDETPSDAGTDGPELSRKGAALRRYQNG
jgi:hypothetical protein